MSFDNSIAYTINNSGISTDMDDYASRLENFLITECSFTLIADRPNDPEVGVDYKVYSKDNIFYHFLYRYTTSFTGIEGFLYTHINKDYNPLLDFFNQTNTPTRKNGYEKSYNTVLPFLESIGTPQYYFFWNGRNLYIINEFDVGFYSHLSMGKGVYYGNKDHLYISSTLNDQAINSSEIEGDFSGLYVNNINTYTLFIDDIYIDVGEIDLDGGRENTNYPHFTDNFKKCSFINTEYKGFLWSPSCYLKSSDSNLIYTPVIKHPDNFVCYTDWFNNLEEYYIGIKKFKFFPFYQKEYPANLNSAGKGSGICLRIE